MVSLPSRVPEPATRWPPGRVGGGWWLTLSPRCLQMKTRFDGAFETGRSQRKRASCVSHGESGPALAERWLRAAPHASYKDSTGFESRPLQEAVTSWGSGARLGREVGLVGADRVWRLALDSCRVSTHLIIWHLAAQGLEVPSPRSHGQRQLAGWRESWPWSLMAPFQPRRGWRGVPDPGERPQGTRRPRRGVPAEGERSSPERAQRR